MNGRVLSEEEIQEHENGVISWIGSLPKSFHDEQAYRQLNLIATIRDSQQREQKLAKKVLESAEIIHELREQLAERDKTIAELQDSTHYAIGRAVHRLQQQNTILREALEEIAGYQIGEKGTCDISLYYCVTDAREALAKVK